MPLRAWGVRAVAIGLLAKPTAYLRRRGDYLFIANIVAGRDTMSRSKLPKQRSAILVGPWGGEPLALSKTA